MRMADQTYDEDRARKLRVLLLSLAQRITELEERGALLAHANEVMRLIGDAKSELFHYEVRATYDTPEVAESRRIVADARERAPESWERADWNAEDDDKPRW